jgi:hypothetical protein
MDYLDSKATTAALATGDVDRTRWRRYVAVVVLAMIFRLDLSQPRIFLTFLWELMLWVIRSPEEIGVFETLFDDPYNLFVLQLIGLKLAGFLVLQGGGLWHVWRLNAAADGRDFWYRYTVLAAPAGLLALFIGMLLVPVVFRIAPDLTDPDVRQNVPFIIMAYMLGVELFYFFRVRRCFVDLHEQLAQARQAKSLDPPVIHD